MENILSISHSRFKALSKSFFTVLSGANEFAEPPGPYRSLSNEYCIGQAHSCDTGSAGDNHLVVTPQPLREANTRLAGVLRLALSRTR